MVDEAAPDLRWWDFSKQAPALKHADSLPRACNAQVWSLELGARQRDAPLAGVEAAQHAVVEALQERLCDGCCEPDWVTLLPRCELAPPVRGMPTPLLRTATLLSFD